MGGGSRDVLGLINDINKIELEWKVIGFVGKGNEKENELIEGYQVLNYEKLPTSNKFYAITSVTDPYLKKKIVNTQIKQKGYRLATLIHPNNDLRDKNNIGPGCVIFSSVRTSYNVKVGKSVWIDCNSNIGHNVNIGKYTSIFPMSLVLGSIGDNCQIGARSIIHQSVKIGNDSMVGMGTTVIKDVSDKTKIIHFPRNVTSDNF